MTGLLILIAAVYACETALRIAGKESIWRQLRMKMYGIRANGEKTEDTAANDQDAEPVTPAPAQAELARKNVSRMPDSDHKPTSH